MPPKKETPAKPGPVCFVAGTLVQTPDGPIPIDALDRGQIVLAKGEGQPISAYRVLDCIHGMTRKLYHIEVGDSSKITSTRNHPFFVAGKGWTSAHKLEIGDGLISLDGTIVLVTTIDRERLINPVDTFNIHVEDVSTYFVGDGLAVWVHNNDPPGPEFDEDLYWGFSPGGPRLRFPSEGPPKVRRRY
jgi:Pretoxin HINT domain